MDPSPGMASRLELVSMDLASSMDRSPALTHRVISWLGLGPPSLLPCDLGWYLEMATTSGPALPAVLPTPEGAGSPCHALAARVFVALTHCTSCHSKHKGKLLNVIMYLVRKCGIGENLVCEEIPLVSI